MNGILNKYKIFGIKRNMLEYIKHSSIDNPNFISKLINLGIFDSVITNKKLVVHEFIKNIDDYIKHVCNIFVNRKDIVQDQVETVIINTLLENNNIHLFLTELNTNTLNKIFLSIINKNLVNINDKLKIYYKNYNNIYNNNLNIQNNNQSLLDFISTLINNIKYEYLISYVFNNNLILSDKDYMFFLNRTCLSIFNNDLIISKV